jgi:uncharacterized membrane protein
MDRLLYMDAEITPNRSLSRRGFVILISLVTAMNCISAAVFMAMGAHLVPIFLGLDVAAIGVAFLVSYAAARRIERVQVSSADVSVTYETPKARRLVWRSPTAFTRVGLDIADEDAVEVKLMLSGREIPVAMALSSGERAEFAKALQDAIWRARAERG